MKCQNPVCDAKAIRTYCSRSCAAVVNNRLFKKRLKRLKRERPKKTSLQQQAWERVEAGTCTVRQTIRGYIIAHRGHRCECCLNIEWLSRPIPLELDHIDGDASNDDLNNLRVICPNCHASTDTWKGRNRGNGRKSRNLPLH